METKTRQKKAKKKADKKSAQGSHRVAKPSADTGPVVFGSHPSIKNVGEITTRLEAAVDCDATIVLDVSNIESVDTAVLQILVAFSNTVREQSRAVEWREPSPAFKELADLTDLSQYLGIGEDSPVEDADVLCPVF